MLTKTFSAVMWEFARVWPLLQMWFFQHCCTSSRMTARQCREGVYAPPSALYGWIYPSLLLVFTLCLTYAVIMPVTLLLGAVYFVFVGIMYTWHLLYVYVPQVSSCKPKLGPETVAPAPLSGAVQLTPCLSFLL